MKTSIDLDCFRNKENLIRNFLEDPDVEDVVETSSRDTDDRSPCVIIVTV